MLINYDITAELFGLQFSLFCGLFLLPFLFTRMIINLIPHFSSHFCDMQKLDVLYPIPPNMTLYVHKSKLLHVKTEVRLEAL